LTDSVFANPITPFNLLNVPGIGRLLRWRWGRLTLQIPLLIVALLLIYDGFTGDPRASRNLATITPWVHFRGVAVLALLLAGNLFCMGCPFTIPRTLAKRLSIRGRRFPRILRGKWVAIASLFALFFVYEWLDLWASPALTAWLIIAYFVGSFVLEAVFTESAFCKYVCPLGTFNFTYSTVSPLHVGVNNPTVCQTCVGKECVNGSYSPQPVILIDQIGVNGEADKTHIHSPQGTLGCGTLLFPPTMQTNMDCTLCLDCVRACPHDNVAVFAHAPAAELSRPKVWGSRYDLSFMVICLAFMGLLNAFGMIPPVYDLLNSLAHGLGLTGRGLSDSAIEFVALGLIFIIGGVILPVGLSLGAAWLARSFTNTVKRDTLRTALTTFAPIFVPIGLGFWAAHYGFHFLTGIGAIIPAFQQFMIDHGIVLFGQPDWLNVGVTDMQIVGLVQLVALLAGYSVSLWIGQKIAVRHYKRQGMIGFMVWALLLTAMMLAALWLFDQPMEMRGVTFS
jgi:ferredoxin